MASYYILRTSRPSFRLGTVEREQHASAHHAVCGSTRQACACSGVFIAQLSLTRSVWRQVSATSFLLFSFFVPFSSVSLDPFPSLQVAQISKEREYTPTTSTRLYMAPERMRKIQARKITVNVRRGKKKHSEFYWNYSRA